ncbi:putative proteinC TRANSCRIPTION FACTORS 60 [Salix koriyanagi]|uniref:Uncharacterized protein n=1 Tax=Salix koriyanagi TaxID=2511006 RepID=A0A9Q0VC36_9ROSI|nr:putative proteinC TRANSCRIPTION FACTORS 60 [Salix koriyanagi]KAJ6745969.1 putative proteinC TRANSCRIPTION FACTORS 60 [Salix koriyanagi]
MEILKNGFSSFECKKAKPAEGGRGDSQAMDTGKPLALLVLFTLPIVIVALARKEPWCSTREGLPNGRKTEWKMNEFKAMEEVEEEEEATLSNGGHTRLRQEFSLCRVYKNKFVRAFDRRPIGVEMGEMRAQATPFNEVTSSHQNPSTVEIACSDDISSLGDHGQPFQTGEASNMASMDIDNEPIWDWEQFDWC